MECLPVVLLPCIMKWSVIQDLLIWRLVIFSGVTWNRKYLSPLHAICRIYKIKYWLDWKMWGKSQVWYTMLLEVCKKGHNMADMLNKTLQKQSPMGVRQNSNTANMQKIYRRTPMWKCDFNNVAMQLYWNHTSPWVFSCVFAAYLRNIFFEEHLWKTASKFVMLENQSKWY